MVREWVGVFLVFAISGVARGEVSIPLEAADRALAVAGDRLVVERGGRLVGIGADGAATELLRWPKGGELQEVAGAGATVHAWVKRGARAELWRSDAPARPWVTLPAGTRRELAVGDRFACWIEGPPIDQGPLPPPPRAVSRIVCQPLAGGKRVVAAARRREPTTLTAHGSLLVWSEGQEIFAVDEPGASPRRLAAEPLPERVKEWHRGLSDPRVRMPGPAIAHVSDGFVFFRSVSGAWRVPRAGGPPAAVSWMGDGISVQDERCAYLTVDGVEVVCLPPGADKGTRLVGVTAPESISGLYLGAGHLYVVVFSRAGGTRRAIELPR